MVYYHQGTTEAEKFLRKFSSAFEELFSHVYYLGPARVHPQRHYHWEGSHPEDLGRCGDKAIEALLSARVDKLTIQSEEKKVPIEERISEWLREMDLAHSFLLERTGPQGGKDYDVRLQKRETRYKSNSGRHGIRLITVFAGSGSLLLCPKRVNFDFRATRHPPPIRRGKLTSRILLIEVIIERNLQILVESHSEHSIDTSATANCGAKDSC